MVSGHGRLFTEKSQTLSWCFIINHQLSFTSCSASSSSSLAQFLLFVCNIHFLNKKKLESRGTKDESRERSNLATNRSQPVFLFSYVPCVPPRSWFFAGTFLLPMPSSCATEELLADVSHPFPLHGITHNVNSKTLYQTWKRQINLRNKITTRCDAFLAEQCEPIRRHL